MDDMGAPEQDQANHYQQQSGGGSVPLAFIGAALGAAVGAAIWAAVEYYAHVQVGYIAIAVGALAGWGAITLGRTKGPTIGIIAAALGLAGVVGGSFGSFYIDKHSEKTKNEIREMVDNHPETQGMSAEQKTMAFEMLYKKVLDEYTYVEHLKSDEKGMVFMALFGVLGVAYGFKVGRGS